MFAHFSSELILRQKSTDPEPVIVALTLNASNLYSV